MKTNEERVAKLYDADAAGDASYWGDGTAAERIMEVLRTCR